VLTPEERVQARERVNLNAPQLALWDHDPAIATGARLYARQVGLASEVVNTAAALLSRAPESAVLVLDAARLPCPYVGYKNVCVMDR